MALRTRHDGRTPLLSLIAPALLAAQAWLAGPALAQATQQFFMVLNGRVSAAGGVSAREGDLFVARMSGQTFTTAVNSTGQFQGLSLSKVGNDPAPITFQLRQGGSTYTLVAAAGDTTPLSVPFSGSNNPLSAAFNAQTVNSFIGPRVGGTTPDPDPGAVDGDPRDVDQNGLIELHDATLVMEFVVGFRDSTLVPARFDANSDGRINTDDVVTILRHVGEEAEVPEPAAGANANPLTQVASR